MSEIPEMVERVAEAMHDAVSVTGMPWDPSDAGNKGYYDAQYKSARAAMEAMRFPVGASSVPGGLAIEESMFGSEDTVPCLEWREVMDEPMDEKLREAAFAFRETMLSRADAHHGSAPLWHGWAIFSSYKAGVLAERERCANQVKAFRESVADSDDLETLEHVIRYGGIEP